MQTDTADITQSLDEQKIWQLLETISDPEIPVLSITDLGIVREVKCGNTPDKAVIITITPTYSGCPAMDMIAMQIRMLLLENGYKNIAVKTTLSPVWTTDWMTEAGKQKLHEYGIAPPVGKSLDDTPLTEIAVACPQCRSTQTRPLSEFGSTACKALFICNNCLEPFDYFKCH